MKDSMKSCQHTLSDDVVYKEVVVIGNGPSGMVTSFMLAGNVPYLKDIPEDLPIDEMLRARLSNLPRGQSLYETDLMELAEGLEGRSQNPLPLLMDNLLRPCADLGIQADSLIEWKFDIEKQMSHVVLGRGPPGGAWHSFPLGVRTLSPAAWLCLPPHSAGAARLSARAVAKYCRRYVHACKLQKYFRCGVTVTSVTRIPPSSTRCHNTQCPLNANFCVAGFDNSSCRPFRYLCRRVVVACGGGDRPNTLAHDVATHALHSLASFERAVHVLSSHAPGASVLVVGGGVSAADGVRLGLRAGHRLHHLHRAPADALARLSPAAYPDYCQVYKMMCDGPSGNHNNYTPYPEHMIIEVTPENDHNNKLNPEDDIEDYALSLKRVKLLNLNTKEITEIQVHIIGVFIGSKPDLFFLQTNFLDCIDIKIDCSKCIEESKVKRKIEEKQCFLKNHWLNIKSMLGQSIQSCKSRYLNYSEINGNTDAKCIIPDCNKRNIDKSDKDCDIIEKCQIIPYSNEKVMCTCEATNPYTSGLGFGIDPKKAVDGRNNPIAIDKSSHEILNGPEGMYALGPLTADNFVRFIPGGALAIVSHMHQNKQRSCHNQ